MQDRDGAFALARAPRPAVRREALGNRLHRRARPLRRRVEHGAACAALRGGLHDARSRLRADRDAHAVRPPQGAARAHDPADHHAAVRDRARPHPDLRPLRAGQSQSLESLFGWQPGRWIYGLPGVLLAQVFAFTPIAFLVLIGVVEGVSPSLEEAAQTLRADRWRVFADVSLPLMRPGLANAFLISFIESIADFGNPILLGGNFSAAVDGDLLLRRRRAARPGSRGNARRRAAAARARGVRSCSAGSSVAACTRRSPARVTAGYRCRCPIRSAGSATGSRCRGSLSPSSST